MPFNLYVLKPLCCFGICSATGGEGLIIPLAQFCQLLLLVIDCSGCVMMLWECSGVIQVILDEEEHLSKILWSKFQR